MLAKVIYGLYDSLSRFSSIMSRIFAHFCDSTEYVKREDDAHVTILNESHDIFLTLQLITRCVYCNRNL